MQIAKPSLVEVLGRLDAMGFCRRSGSPFKPPKIKGHAGAPPEEEPAVAAALDTFIGSLTPREVQAVPLVAAGVSDNPFAELNLTAFLDYIASERFRPETIGVATKSKEWDAAGWYCPVHFYSFDWGIYIRPQSVFDIALDILSKYYESMTKAVLEQAKDRVPWFERDDTMSDERKERHRQSAGLGPTISGRYYQVWLDHGYIGPITQCIVSAYLILFQHELFHHLVESFATKWEFIAEHTIYVSYSDSVYKRAKGTNELIEEALANAFAYRTAERSRLLTSSTTLSTLSMQTITIDYLRQRFPIDPPGYNRALEFVSDEGFDRGIGLLLAQLREVNVRPLRTKDGSVLRAEFDPLFGEENVRCVEIPESRGQKILPPASLPFDNRGKKLQKLLQLAGFTLKRQGPHEVWVKPGFPPIPVPRAKSLADGTVESIMKKIDPGFRLRNFEEIVRGLAA